MHSETGLQIALFGGTGLLGKALVRHFTQEGYRVAVFTRNTEQHPFTEYPDVSVFPFDHTIREKLEGMDVVINLTGESISRRWTKKRKEKILLSRINSTRSIVEALNRLEEKPNLFVQTSAVGIYPQSRDLVFNEDSTPGHSFLSGVVQQWEKSAESLDGDIRKAVIRLGVVISSGGGMLPRIVLLLKTMLGGTPGSGKNWISWIHVDDVVKGIEFFFKNQDLKGVFNFTAPEPVLLKNLIKESAAILNRPSFLRIPVFLIKVLFGEMGKELLLGSQKAVPENLLQSGYTFRYPQIREALEKELSG